MEKLAILALDQGTTSSRAALYDGQGRCLGIEAKPLPVSFPQPAWVEQDPREIWATLAQALRALQLRGEWTSPTAIGITNQRETVICWDRKTGEPLAPAIVWQCRRSEAICRRLREEGMSQTIGETTGLVVDPYFSATKIAWLLENVSGLREKVKRKEAVFGTVDTWIIFQLTGANAKAKFVTEASNASRTMLFDLKKNDWSEELLPLFGLTRENLPQILPSFGHFADAVCDDLQAPITGVLGDQQAALLGHGCTTVNSAKCTFGTGAFLLLNTGKELRRSSSGMLSTVAWSQKCPNSASQLTYAIEGSVFVAGSLIQWLRDKLKIITNASESETLASQVENSGGVVIVPSFVGMGAPHWQDSARGAIFGLTRDSDARHLARAALEAVALQVVDILDTLEFTASRELSIDGGMSKNALFCQILADLSGRDILVATEGELTVLGAAIAAEIGLNGGSCNKKMGLTTNFGSKQMTGRRRIKPVLSKEICDKIKGDWRRALQGVLHYAGKVGGN